LVRTNVSAAMSNPPGRREERPFRIAGSW
jgi:hypothetical protein